MMRANENPHLEASIQRLCWGPQFQQLKRFVQGESDEIKAELLARVIAGEIGAQLCHGVVTEPERLLYTSGEPEPEPEPDPEPEPQPEPEPPPAN